MSNCSVIKEYEDNSPIKHLNTLTLCILCINTMSTDTSYTNRVHHVTN